MAIGGPGPKGPYKRLWMEFEVEVVDEDALRAFEVHWTGDGEGNPTGLMNFDVDALVELALGRVMVDALRAAVAETGVRWLNGSGPMVRAVDEAGNYKATAIVAMPQRREDGEYDDWPPKA